MNTPLTDVEKILVAASERGRQSQLPYAGAVTPQEAHRLFARHDAKIVDVRSRFEYDYIGRIDPSTLISWKFWPSGEPNRNFLAELKAHCSLRWYSPNRYSTTALKLRQLRCQMVLRRWCLSS